jgi:NTE family protein
MKKIATVVLSGGGARGLAHIGVIEEIEKRGYSINSIAGTSMGALIGGVYATGKLNEFKEWMYKLDKKGVLKLVDFTLSSQGFIKGDRVLQAMKKFIPDANIEDLHIKFTATAYDLIQNKEVVFKEGSLFNAIRASISIPTVFTPVIMGNAVLVDGGVSNNIPVNNACRLKNDLLIAVNVNSNNQAIQPLLQAEKTKTHRFPGKNLNISLQKDKARDRTIDFNYLKIIDSTISALTNNLAASMIKSYPPDILIEISRKSCSTFDFYKAEELVEIGRLAAREKFDEWRGDSL